MKEFTTEELLEMITNRGLKPVMIVTVKQESFEPYKVPYTNMTEFLEDKRIFNLTLLDTEYVLSTVEDSVNEPVS